MEHTKTPWMVAGQKPGNCGPQQEQDRLIYTKDENGHPLHIAETFQYQNHGHNAADGTSINNAAFIVRAVNMHERLVEAVRWLLPYAERRITQVAPVTTHSGCLDPKSPLGQELEYIRALLAEAEKEGV